MRIHLPGSPLNVWISEPCSYRTRMMDEGQEWLRVSYEHQTSDGGINDRQFIHIDFGEKARLHDIFFDGLALCYK